MVREQNYRQFVRRSLLIIAWAVTFAAAAPGRAVAADAPMAPLRILCSNSSYSLLEDAASAYRDVHPAVAFQVQPIPNDWMIRQLALGRADMAVHSGPLPDADHKAINVPFPNHGKFMEHPFAHLTVAIVAHDGLGIRVLTTHQIGHICTGEVTNWEQLGGPRRKIVLVGQSPRYNSGYILRKTCYPDQQFDAQLVEKTNRRAVVETVKSTPGAIGFFLHDWQEIDGLRPLSIVATDKNGQPVGKPAPLTQAEVLEGHYPLVETLFAVFYPKAPHEAYNFMEFLKSEMVAKIGSERRMLTEFHRQELLREKRLAQQRAGQGTELTIAGPPGNAKLASDLGRLYVEENDLLQIKYAAQRDGTDAVAALTAGEAELLLVDGDAAEFAAQLSEYGSQVLGRRAVGVIVHPSNKIEELLIADLKMIYEGEVPSWPGQTTRLQMIGPESSGVVAEVFREAIGGGRRKVAYAAKGSTEEIIRTVAREKAAIGIVDLSDFPENQTSVRLVPITTAGRQPTPIVPGEPLAADYPLARAYTLYVAPTASEAARDFARFVKESTSTDTLKTHGLLP